MPITIRQPQAKLGSNVRQIAPTLLIGLGGTGKEVLLRTRRRFFERFGEVGLPLLSYLWIDTDMRNVDLEGEKYDYLMERVAFGNDERVDLQLPGQSFSAYFRDPESYPHIFSWLDPSLASFGQVVDGAGQKRPFGRLTFFHHQRRIRDRILAMKNDVLGAVAAERLTELCQRHGLQEPKVDRSRIDVIFVFSVAGGTGSGMFLDAAFFVRDALAGNSPSQTAYLFLPSVFNPDIKTQAGEPIYANGYAALKELEHYSLAKDLLRRKDDAREGSTFHSESDHHFRVEWSRGDKRSLIGPPFNTCYLLDNQSAKARQALRPGEKKSLCDMVAEAIFLEFNEGNFAALKRSTRSNLEQFLLAKVDMDYVEQDSAKTLFTETFSCRFSSFGLTKLFVPADRIRRSNAYRLAIEVVRGLLNSPPQPGDLSLQLKQHHFEPMGLSERQVIRGLALNDDNTDKLIHEELKRRIAEAEETWLSALPEAVSRDVRDLRAQLQRDLAQDADPTARPGDFLARIRDANPQLLGRRLFGRFDPNNDDLWAILNDDPERALFGVTPTGSIGRVVRAWLDDPRFRLPLACGYLDGAAAIYKDEFIPSWRKAADQRRELARSLNESINRRLSMLEDEETSSKRLPSKKALVHRLRRDLQGWIAAQVEERAYLVGVDFVENRLLPYLDRLIRYLRQLEKDLSEIVQQLEKRRESFEKDKGHHIFEEVIDRDLIDKSYTLRTADGFMAITPSLLLGFEKDLLRALELRGTGDLGYFLALKGSEGVVYSLEGLAFERFRDLQVRFDVLEEARRVFGDKLDDRLRTWAARGAVWLPPGEVVSRLPTLDETYMDVIFLGAPESQKKEAQRQIEVITRALTEGGPPRSGAIQPLQSAGTDAVYVYSEAAGIAVPYVRQIERYLRDAYLSSRRKQTVHIDFFEEHFPQDIVIQEFHEVRQFLAAYRLLIQGTITGVLKIRKGTSGRLAWSYMDYGRRPPQPVELGPELFALNTLRNQEPVARQVAEKIRLGIDALEPIQLPDLYSVCWANLEPTGAFPLRWRFYSGESQEVSSHGRHILSDFLLELEKRVLSQSGLDATLLRSAIKSGSQLEEISETVPWLEPKLRVLKNGVPEPDA